MSKDKIKETCEILGITQKELSKLMGIHPNTLSNWRDELPEWATKFMDTLVEKEQLTNASQKLIDSHDELKKLLKK